MIWKAIEGFEGYYEVSDLGQVKALSRSVYSLKTGKLHQRRKERMLKPHYARGYAMVILCKEGKTYARTIHRLVACAFIPNPDNLPCVDHIDTNPRNNSVDNLRWVSQSENCMNPLTRIHNSESKKGHRGYLTHHTEESKRKMSAAKKGKPLTQEHIKHSVEAKRAKREERRLAI